MPVVPNFVTKLGSQVVALRIPAIPRESSFLFQRISRTIQRAVNAAAGGGLSEVGLRLALTFRSSYTVLLAVTLKVVSALGPGNYNI